MNVTMVYFSQTGNTRKVAEAMAVAFRESGHDTRTVSLNKATPEDAITSDMLGVGSPCFTGQAPTPIKEYLRALPPLDNRRAFVFATSGGAPGKVLYDLTRPLRRKGADVIGGTLIRGECFHPSPCFIGRYPGRPNADDLAKAQRFAIAAAEYVSGAGTGPLEESRRDALRQGWGLYDFEGLLTDPLVRLVLPKPKLDRTRCDNCQWCVYECPMDNITIKDYPFIGARCIRCYRCLTGCPKSAFSANWLLGNSVLLSLHSTVFERLFGDLDCDEQIYCHADKPTSNWSFRMLVAALNGRGNKRVCAAAARALGEIGHEQATGALISALGDVRRGNHSEVREAAAQALGSTGNGKAAEPLISALRDKEKYVRLAAVKALGIIGSERAVKGLISVLEDDHWIIRKAVAETLGSIGTQQTVMPLLLALEDESPAVRQVAEKALNRILE